MDIAQAENVDSQFCFISNDYGYLQICLNGSAIL